MNRSLYPKFKLECNSPALVDQYMVDYKDKDKLLNQCRSIQQSLIYACNGNISEVAPLSQYPGNNLSPDAWRLIRKGGARFVQGGVVVPNVGNRNILNDSSRFEFENIYGMH